MQALWVKIKNNSKPCLLECMTTRWCDHVGITVPELSAEEVNDIETAIQEDDLKNLENELKKDTVLDIKKRVDKEIETAIKFAEASEFPKDPELFENIYG